MKADFEGEIGDLSAPVDDPVFLELNAKFMGAILYDFETRASKHALRNTRFVEIVSRVCNSIRSIV